ncbi:VanZ like family protein [compost metagenome]
MFDRIPRALWVLAFTICLVSVLALALMKNPSALLNTGWDKGNHVLAFTVLTFLGRMSFPAQRALLLLGLLGYGVLIENLQLMTGYRFGEYQDLAADVVGMVLGYLLAVPLMRRVQEQS